MYNLKRDFEHAIADYDQALKLDPKAVSYYNDRAASGATRATSSVHLRLQHSNTPRPENLSALINRGIAYRDKGTHDRAIADFNKIIQIDPNYTLGYANRGWTYNLKGDFERRPRRLQSSAQARSEISLRHQRSWYCLAQ